IVGNPGSIQFAVDGTLVWSEQSASGKSREIRAWKSGAVPRTLWKDQDDRWFSPTARDSKVMVSPDQKSVAFVSDRSGWIHVYVTPVQATAECQAKQLTTGNFLAGLGSWSSDSRRIAYPRSAVGNQMERFIDMVDAASGKADTIVADRGVNFDPSFSPD